MSKHRTQVQRVIAAARSYRGITQVDLLGPDTFDGGPPITRLAARLWDAEQDGYSFECLGRRDKCKIWRLCGEPDVEGGDGGSGGGVRSIPSSSDRSPVAALDAGVEDGRLFDAAPERTHHYDQDMAA